MAVTIDWLVSSVGDGSNGGRHRGGQDGGVSHGMVSHGMVSHVGVSVEPEVSTGGGQESRQAEESLGGGGVFNLIIMISSQLSVLSC